MIRVFIFDNKCINVDNDIDAENLLKKGAQEINDLSVFNGLDSFVSPDNVDVLNDGTLDTSRLKAECSNKENEIAQLDAEYEKNKQQLMQYYFEFSIAGDTEGMEAIKAELAALNQQYDNDLAEIEKG